MKRIMISLLCVISAGQLMAQKYFTRNANVSFYSKTSAETIEAQNSQVLAVINVPAREVAFNLLVKGFLFQKQLMQDHFNEEVIESDKYPKADFTGKIMEEVDLSKPGIYKVHVNGNLSMHGVTKPVTTEATLTVSTNGIKGSSVFKISYDDYHIKLPALLKNTISPTIAITVKIDAKPMAK